MKRILLPTDYSENAKQAIDFVFQLFDRLYPGNQQEIEYILLHAYPLPTAMPIFGQMPPAALVPPIDEEEKRLQSNAAIWKQRYPDRPIKPVLVGGPLLNAILTTVQEEDINLVAMGTRGAIGMEEVLLGSNAARAAQSLDVPVLIIPEQASFKAPEHIVLATDFQRVSDLSLLNPLQRILNTFNTHLLTLHVLPEGETPTKEKERINQMLRSYFGDRRYDFHYLPSDDPATAIEAFLKEHKADWLVLIGKQRTFLESLFHRSVIRKMTFHTTIPLLVLH